MYQAGTTDEWFWLLRTENGDEYVACIGEPKDVNGLLVPEAERARYCCGDWEHITGITTEPNTAIKVRHVMARLVTYRPHPTAYGLVDIEPGVPVTTIERLPGKMTAKTTKPATPLEWVTQARFVEPAARDRCGPEGKVGLLVMDSSGPHAARPAILTRYYTEKQCGFVAYLDFETGVFGDCDALMYYPANGLSEKHLEEIAEMGYAVSDELKKAVTSD